MDRNRIAALFNIEIPIIQAGMVWCSGWRLASEVSKAGGLGIIGAGSLHPDNLRYHIRQLKIATDKPFGVNVPLLYPEMDQIIQIIREEGVPIVFTSAGNPGKYTATLKSAGCKVVHVVSSVKFALKAEAAGVDAIVAEGFEAGGHNGREETTTMVLVPMVCEAVKIPVIAAGGICDGKSIVAAFALGAMAVQIGSRFAVTQESSAHSRFKERVLQAEEGSTILTLKALTPVRLLKNRFYEILAEAEARGATNAELEEIVGSKRARKGIFEGDMEEGELEIGQVAYRLTTGDFAGQVVRQLWSEVKTTLDDLEKLRSALF